MAVYNHYFNCDGSNFRIFEVNGKLAIRFNDREIEISIKSINFLSTSSTLDRTTTDRLYGTVLQIGTIEEQFAFEFKMEDRHIVLRNYDIILNYINQILQ
jgi:hypothetical protein